MKPRDPLKPAGAWEVRRRIRIPALADAADAAAAESALGRLPGVRGVAADARTRQVAVRYDASRTAYREIAAALESAGFPPAGNWWGRLRGGWYQFSDTNARENAQAPPPACCNKPPRR